MPWSSPSTDTELKQVIRDHTGISSLPVPSVQIFKTVTFHLPYVHRKVFLVVLIVAYLTKDT